MARLNPRHRVTVTVWPPAGLTVHGPQPGDPITGSATFLGATQLVRTTTGDLVAGKGRLFVAGHGFPDSTITDLFVEGATVTANGRDFEVAAVRPVLARGRLVYLDVTLA